MQVIEIGARYRLPDAASEIGTVIAGGTAVFSFFKVEVVCIFAVWICKCLLKPFVLVRAVVDYQIHHDRNPSLFRLGQELVELLHGTELRCDLIVIGDVVSLIHKWRLVNRGYPYNIDSQFL